MNDQFLNGYKLTIEKGFLLVLIAIISYLLVQLLAPFSYAILWAFTLAIVLQPWQEWLKKRISSKTLVALIGVATAVTVILVPLFFIAFQISKEVKIIYKYFQNTENIDNLIAMLKNSKLAYWIEENLGITAQDIKDSVSEKVSQILNIALQYTTSLISNSFVLIINFIFTLFTLFFLLRDKEIFVNWLLKFLPISIEKRLELVDKIKQVIKATLLGNVVVAITQAVLAGLMFYILGVPATLIWTVIMAILAMIPMVGTAFIWLPAAVWLILTGSLIKGIVLIFWGVFVVGLIDNILRPILVGRQTNLPTIVTFYSVLGGIKIFGPLGLVLGPLIVVSFITILNFIFSNNEEQAESNRSNEPTESNELNSTDIIATDPSSKLEQTE